MTKIAMVQEALISLGEVPPQILSEYIQNKHGTTIDPKFIPVLRASIREKELLDKFRLQSMALQQSFEPTKKVSKRKKITAEDQNLV